VLALTVSCARCHDHKFDPVPTKDYYALAGIFTSTEPCDGLRSQMGGGGLAYYVPDRLILLGESSGPDAQTQEQIKALRDEVQVARTAFTDFRDQVKEENAAPERDEKLQELRQAWQTKQADLVALTDPAKQGPVALGVRDAKQVSDTEVRVRGEAEKLGPVVERGYLSLLSVPNAAPINPRQSGRLELAYWLTSPENPLATRVAVNRVWKHLFGDGLVTTVDNFGVTGDQPSHPELLDHLANRFVKDGWSVKRLIRAIVLSRTYQLGSDANEEYLKVDPANRFVWRHTPRRLDAEEIRDAMLAASGKLDAKRPEGSPAKDLLVRELRNDGAEAKALRASAAASVHRSVYLPLLRGIVPHSLEVFDFAEPTLVTGQRDATTIAPQSLYLLNDAFVLKQSLAFADGLLANESISDEERIRRVYLLALGRKAAEEEVGRARKYLNDYALAAAEIPAPQPVASAPAETSAEGEAPAAASAQPATPAPTPPAAKEEAPKKKKKGPAIVNPDQLPRGNEVLEEEVVVPGNPRAAAWASLIQAIYGSAEFRYLR
jgi:hypothetical protein